MPNLAAEDIATGAKTLMESAWGQWFVAELERRERDHLDRAEGSDAHNLTVNGVMRAAGVREALKLITTNAGVADSTLFKKK